jgi:hypothetical protein
MFARLVVLQGAPDRADDAIRFMEEQIVPRIKQQAGFQGGYWALDRSSGKAIGLTLWESEQAAADTEAFTQRMQPEGEAATGGQLVSTETFEVFAQA